MKKLYFDYAATTPINKEVLEEMLPYFGEHFGNPGSVHGFGQKAIATLDSAREAISKIMKTDFRGIIFTSGATEANNLIIQGVVKGFYRFIKKDILPLRVIVSAIEHESVLKTVEHLSDSGVEVVVLPVDGAGKINLDDLKGALNERTVLVSLMAVNNEIGSVNPIREAAKIISEFREELFKSGKSWGKIYPIFHTDAVQAFQYFDVEFENYGCDAITVSGHKIYGPKGVGILAFSKRLLELNYSQIIFPLILGGGQEFGMRSGTENVANIAGFSKAIELVESGRVPVAQEIRELKNRLWEGIKKIAPNAKVNGSEDFSDSAPHILNVWFPGKRSETLMTQLDLGGLMASSGSACNARAFKPSYVIKALGHNVERASESIRFSIGKGVMEDDVDEAFEIIKNIYK